MGRFARRLIAALYFVAVLDLFAPVKAQEACYAPMRCMLDGQSVRAESVPMKELAVCEDLKAADVPGLVKSKNENAAKAAKCLGRAEAAERRIPGLVLEVQTERDLRRDAERKAEQRPWWAAGGVAVGVVVTILGFVGVKAIVEKVGPNS